MNCLGRDRHLVSVMILKSAGVVLALGSVYSCSPDRSQTLSSVEFSLERNAILVRTMLNDDGPFTLLVDTGTDPSVIDSTLADKLTWPAVSIGSHGSGAGGRSAEVTLLPPLAVKFGTSTPERKMFLGVDLKPIGDRLGTPVHGILGYNVLAGKRVVIDFPNEQIMFGGYGNEKKHFLYFPMYINPDDPMPEVQGLLFVNGVSLRVSIDTGFNGSLFINPSGLTLLGIEPKTSDRCREILGYGGSVPRCETDVDTIRIGERYVDEIEILYDPAVTNDTGTAHARVGNTLQTDSVVVFDYANQQFGISK